MEQLVNLPPNVDKCLVNLPPLSVLQALTRPLQVTWRETTHLLTPIKPCSSNTPPPTAISHGTTRLPPLTWRRLTSRDYFKKADSQSTCCTNLKHCTHQMCGRKWSIPVSPLDPHHAHEHTPSPNRWSSRISVCVCVCVCVYRKVSNTIWKYIL